MLNIKGRDNGVEADRLLGSDRRLCRYFGCLRDGDGNRVGMEDVHTCVCKIVSVNSLKWTSNAPLRLFTGPGWILCNSITSPWRSDVTKESIWPLGWASFCFCFKQLFSVLLLFGKPVLQHQTTSHHQRALIVFCALFLTYFDSGPKDRSFMIYTYLLYHNILALAVHDNTLSSLAVQGSPMAKVHRQFDIDF